jgi:selenoprotein W-related protein
MLRAAWIAQELLTTFESELGEVALIPAHGGRFQIQIDGQIVWDRQRDGGFPELSWLKRAIRNQIAPSKSLGHTDRSHTRSGHDNEAAPK